MLGGVARAPVMQPGSQFYQVPFDLAYKKVAARRNLRKLEALFFDADTDHSGAMSIDEFNEALRIPRIQRAFSTLGVQPHQSELVFKSLDKAKRGQLRIDEFMVGLTDLVRRLGVNPDGSSKELNIEMLRPSYVATQRLLDMSGTDPTTHLSPINAFQTTEVPSRPSSRLDSRPSSRLDSRPSSRASSLPNSRPTSRQAAPNLGGIVIGPVHLLSNANIHRAFVHSASAHALHPATAVKRAVPVFPMDQEEQF